METEIAISGMCILSSAGETASELCERSVSGKTIVPQIDPRPHEEQIASIDTGQHELYRIQKLLLAALLKALRMAGLAVESAATEQAGIFFGNSYGVEKFKSEFFCLYKKSDPALTRPTSFPFTTANALASWLAIQIGAKGPNLTFVDGSVSSSEALFAAHDALVVDECKMAFVGGVNVVDNDLMDEFCASGFRCESIGILMLEKKGDVMSTGRKPFAFLKDMGRSTLTQKQIEKVKTDKSIKNINGKARGRFKSASEIIHLGNNLGENVFVYGKSGYKAIKEKHKVFSLSDATGNVFDAAGVMGVALSAELLNLQRTADWHPFGLSEKSILYSDISSNGSAITMLISKS